MMDEGLLVESIVECGVEEAEGLGDGLLRESCGWAQGERDDVEGVVFVGVLEFLGGDDYISNG